MRLFLLLFFLFFQSYAYAQDFIVVVNRSGPLTDSDMSVVRDIYLGEKKFAGNMRLQPINFTEGTFKDSFLKVVLGMSSKEYKHHWIKKVFQEGLAIPVSMGSPLDIIDFVGKEKGAVAYLPAKWTETIFSGIPRRIEEIVIIGSSAGGKLLDRTDRSPGTPKGD